MIANPETLTFLSFFVPLCVLCAALALTDLRYGIIPDRVNLSIAGLGLLKAVVTNGTEVALELAGEAAGIGLIFWVLRRCYFMLRKIEGLGLGDVKFFAAAATWIGIAGVPTLLLIATLVALMAAGGLQLAGRAMTRQSSLPFGPFLAIGLLLSVIVQRFQAGI